MSTRQHVLLVPGFFGFANLGDFAYFGHVRECFQRHMRLRGVSGEVRVVQTYPTASLVRRAARVAESVAELTSVDDGVVHLVGHSSGGLDLRLFTAPEVSLPTTLDVEKYARKVRTVVTLSAPHRGSPLATFLSSVLGAQLLRVFSLATIYTLRTGRVPIAAVFALVRLLSLRRLPVIDAGTLLNNIYRDLLSDFSQDRREALERFMITVGDDVQLLAQLTPSGVERFNQSTFDRPGVRYGSVVTCALAPGLRSCWAVGASPYRQATHLLFNAFYRITAGMPPAPIGLTHSQATALLRAYGRLPQLRDNDGMVPTLSQVWGEVVHAAWGDHLDAIGHFYLPSHVPPHFDWLNSGARFSLAAFEHIWQDVADFMFRVG
jgi:triacylglycerol esterase/lipase EstA (alpha/beta hydrolase family)